MALNTTFFEVSREGKRGWRWYLVGHNGTVAQSAGYYKTERGAVKGLQRFKGLPFEALPLQRGGGRGQA